ncbi:MULTISPECIES: TolC family protein [unclassified Campylobacter]|uniref:TolC family protein n=1 Tax=unclassified Campylobacter TaxID=2593542 RepID=UPI0014763130|nr:MULTISPECIES: TolC family protein [unclassified Campylobacter]
MKIKNFILLFGLPLFVLAKGINLSEAYEMALQNDDEHKYYMYNSLASVERYSQSKSQLFPTITGNISYRGDKYDRRNKRVNESIRSYGVTLRQQIFQPSLYYQKAQEELRKEQSGLDLELNKQELAKKVAKAYFELVYASENLKLAQSYNNANKARYDQMNKSLSLGLTNKMDMLESKVRYDESIMGVSKANREIEIAKISLFRLVGQDIEVKNYFENLNINFFKAIDLRKYNDTDLNIHYKQSELMTKIAEKEHSKRKSEHLPTIDFSVSYSKDNYTDDRAFTDKDRRVETMIRLNLPIFTSWHTSFRIEEGMLLRQASAARQNDVKKSVDISQKQSIVDLQNYIQEYEIIVQSLENAKIYELSIERGYKEGLRSIVDLLDAKTRVHKIRNDVITTAYKVVLSYLELESLINNINQESMSYLEKAFIE